MNYLLFRLYGPMASWGEIALGENRHSASYPGKSAILGLLGAALGIRRGDESSQQALAQDYSIAVKQVSAGGFLMDYHTAQAPKNEAKGFHFRTRRDEIVLGKKPLGTVLSSREYRTDALAIVAIRASEQAYWSLQQLQQALLKPMFHLYLGRKACPLAAPLQPELMEAEGFLKALTDYQPKELLSREYDWATDERFLKKDNACHYYWQGKLTDFAQPDEVPASQVHQLVRHDQPLSRRRWQFQPRKENLWLQQLTVREDS
ncbi:type I-E CRISPR-associated protein Cas5/CasD [Endozoicomonas numazuensis]|uniref:CRISPR-associated protein Cas5 n=1 Tax=Endozoicomonas numazuensis TaxID=1137799 RepID=A0A081NCR1_9GAMM|nr:type I-E CRISPR-associated protein Cas5/CasD [Endozoicomonas numazuensis]KEQ16234.1 CRISPR-associated protein Cas5 [Endozoicomonas numazuensis]